MNLNTKNVETTFYTLLFLFYLWELNHVGLVKQINNRRLSIVSKKSLGRAAHNAQPLSKLVIQKGIRIPKPKTSKFEVPILCSSVK